MKKKVNILVLFCCLLNTLLGLPIKETQKRPTQHDSTILTREVLVTPVVGLKSGLQVFYKLEKGEVISPNAKKGFKIGYRPTGNWYDQGFISSIIINGKTARLIKSKYPDIIKVSENNNERTRLSCLFETEFGDFSLELLFLKDKYYAYARIALLNAKEKIENMSITLLNYPGHFGGYSKAKLDRVIVAGPKNIAADTLPIELPLKDDTLFYYDKASDFYGESALMFNPENVESVKLTTDSKCYSIKTTINLKKGMNSLNLLMWEFPREKFTPKLALNYLNSKKTSLRKELISLSAEKLKNKISATRAVTPYKMVKANSPISIDGKMDDESWKVIPWTDNFYYLGTDEKTTPKTKFKLSYDDDYLYFYVRCAELDLAGLKAKALKRDGNVWSDDYIEFFFCPYGEHANYFHFAINSLGTVWDSRFNEGQENPEWNSGIEVVPQKGNDYWALEGRIPVEKMLKKDKKTLTAWLANVSRQRPASSTLSDKKRQWSTWSKILVKKFNEPSAFNPLVGFNAPFAKKPSAFLQEDDFNDLYLQDQTIECFFPRSQIFIANNVAAPNYIQIKDSRVKYAKYLGRSSGKVRKTLEWKEYIDNLKIFVKLPKGCSLYTGETGYRAFFSVKQENDYFVISPLRVLGDNRMKMTSIHQIYNQLMLYVKTSLPAGSKGNIQIWIEQKTKDFDVKTNVKSYPFEVVSFPKVQMLKKFIVNIWANRYMFVEPDYVETRKRSGFNSVSLKVTWLNRNKGNKLIEDYLLGVVKKARAEKMKICVHDSTFSRFYFSKEGRWGNTKSPDPTYIGPAYQKDIKAVEDIAKIFKPDYLFIDSEYFSHTVNRKTIDSWPEGKAKITSSGLSEKEYFSDCGDRMALDVKNALKKGCPNRKIKVGFYGTGHNFSRKQTRFPGKEMFDGVYNTHTLLKKQLVDLIQPSPYHSGDMELIINSIQGIMKNAKNSSGKILPWACAGYPYPFSISMVRDQILEVFSLGSVGIVYWGEQSWDVGAYLYQVYAVNEIAPFEDIVMDGKFHEQTEKVNSTGYVKGMVSGNEAIILLSCYKRFKAIEEKVKNPLSIDCAVYDASNRKKIADVKVGESVNVVLDNKRDTKLIYFGNDWNKRINKRSLKK